MKPEPVTEYAAPAYPTRREFLAAGAAAMATAGLSGCGGEAEAAGTLVAPVFAHGEGRGATGCIVVSPPVFMSEEEAMQVIREELGKIGVTLGEGMPMEGVTIEYEDPDARWMRAQGGEWLGEPPAKVPVPVSVTAIDAKRKIAVEVITTKDCNSLPRAVISTVQSYDAKGLAELTADSLREQGKQDLRVGIFYDPMAKWSFEEAADEKNSNDDAQEHRNPFESVSARAKEKSEQQLRQQVRDFVAWLKQTEP